MVRSKSDISRLVFPLVIKPERVSPGFRGRFVEPNLWKQPTCGFNPHHRSALALVGNYLCLEPSVFKMILVALAGDRVLVDPVMRQDALGFLVALGAEFVDVVG